MSLGLLKILRKNRSISNDIYQLILDRYEESSRGRSEAVSVLPLLFEFEVISPQDLAELLADIYDYPIFDLGAYDNKLLLLHLIDDEILWQNRVLPLWRRGHTLFVAVSDPTLERVYKKIFFKLGLDLSYVLVEDDSLMSLFELVRRQSVTILEELGKDEVFNPVQILNDDGTAEDGPIAKFVDKIITDAVSSQASDIHFEFYEHFARIRFRIDGVLREIVQPPLITKDKIASRVKVMCAMDISEKRIPQDGAMKLKIAGKQIDFRVSTLPTLFGEKIVVRILDNTVGFIPLNELGMNEKEQKLLLKTIKRPYGMILVTGPTGSGKTVTLYNCLNILNSPEVNISTVEDPVEIYLPGANQVSMNEKQGLDFARALKSFLRQDPDIIMVGEIRDLETADIAIKASQTGHLVLSTLHTNSAPATLTRLTNMGIEAFNVASSVLLIIAQRLVRKLCPKCKAPVSDVSQDFLYSLGFTEKDFDKGEWTIYGPVGCKACKGTGYKGRIGIYEMMPITENIQNIILKGKDENKIRAAAMDEGMLTLRQAGLKKVKQGITSLEEIIAVTD